MRKYELSLTDGYVSNWTLTDAVREILQNAVDQETVNNDNKMEISYNDGTLEISNKTAVLSPASLLLGHTTKENDSSTIGHFGEGYKIAALVLTRLGKKLTIYNYGNKEKWDVRFVKSRKYDGCNVLTFFVDKFIWSKVPNNNLTFCIEGIEEDEWKEIKKTYLGLCGNVNKLSTIYCDILLDQDYQGNIYVNGLFVTHLENCEFGYDFKPAYIKLERDRRLVSSWNIEYYAGLAWAETYDSLEDEFKERVKSAIHNRKADMDKVRYGYSNKLPNDVLHSIDTKYDTKCIPVSSQDEYDKLVGSVYKPTIVDYSTHELIKKSPIYLERMEQAIPAVKPIKQRLEEWRDRYIHKSRAIKEFNKILDDMEE